MSAFTDRLALEQWGAHKWKTTRYIEYHAENGKVYPIPTGTVTDGASIPRLLWFIIGHPLEEYAESAVLHDLLYAKNGVTRSRADSLLYEAMGVQPIPVAQWKRSTIYSGVRVGGWLTWWRYRRKDKKNK